MFPFFLWLILSSGLGGPGIGGRGARPANGGTHSTGIVQMTSGDYDGTGGSGGTGGDNGGCIVQQGCG